MRPKKITVTGVASSAWIPMDIKQAPFNVSIGCAIVSGTATYTVEHTYDDVYDLTVVPVVFPNAGITGQTTNKDGSYSAPVKAIRLTVTAGTAPVVSMILTQGNR